MSSRFIDLTGDSSDVELSPEPSSNPAMNPQSRATRQPLSVVQNGNRVNARSAPVLSAALKNAINTMDAARLRMHLRQYCEAIPELRRGLERQLLVKGKGVVRYHRNTDSEDDAESENRSSEDEDASEIGREKPLMPIAIGDEEFTPMYAKCENCEEEFDVSCNNTRECHWHTGEKELYYDGDFWADHDDNCHGDPASFEDDSDFADGFMWSCCQNSGDHEGCKTTRHKAPVNVIQEAGSNKRRAEEDLQRPVFARCVTCEKRYDINDNEGNECVHHPGEKELDSDSGHWEDWDDECHGNPETLINDPDHVDGFMWSCCRGEMNSEGCTREPHEPYENVHRR
ncbi:hypothetical protein IFR05_001175 [Cadophora sp. M221]|nr:hypothetical protein IFR05_001175 [Cadophora sp. M221]